MDIHCGAQMSGEVINDLTASSISCSENGLLCIFIVGLDILLLR